MVQELSFQQREVNDRLPPQNLDAEEAILGGILLDPEAMNRIIDALKSDAFYIGSHRDIFRAAVSLHTQGKPTDLTSVATWLKDHNLLDKVGGQTKLAQLVEQTISAVNIDQYAALVMDKYIRRQLITVGTEVAQLGYATDSDLPKILDEAEQKVFGITQSRPQQGLVSMDEILTNTFSDLENRSLGMVLPGLSTNFYDLDAMTQGFQRSDLIIVAGRPSMGKTSFALVVTRNIAAQHQIPVAIFSLEMSKEQLVQRLLSSEVQIESGRLRGGRISQQEWEPLGHGISSLSQLRLFIDDTPNVTITEMRSKVRRLQAEQGGQLGLVMVDYLQLMEGSSSDNRVQELSKITRGLKALAREVNVPVMALSQLSRSVEARTNKRPMMSDLRECVTGDTLVMLADGRRLPIQSLVGTTPKVLAMSADENIVVAESDLVWSVGVKPVFELCLASGRTLKATAQHRIYTAQGWKELQSLDTHDRVAIARHLPSPIAPVDVQSTELWNEAALALLGHLIGNGSYLEGQPLRYSPASEKNSHLVTEAAQALGLTANRHPEPGNGHQLVLSETGNCWMPQGINPWLHKLGMFNQRSHEKQIPTEIFGLENAKVAVFLRHLWATDGTYLTPTTTHPRSRITFATHSSHLAQDVAALLLRFAVVAQIRKVQQGYDHPMFVVEVSDNSMQMTFLDEIGAVGSKVQDAQRLRDYLELGVAKPSQDTLPQEIFVAIKRQMQDQSLNSRPMATLQGTSYGVSSYSRSSILPDAMMDDAAFFGNRDLKRNATSDLFWDEVVSITPVGNAEVFDLTVPGAASWLADGLVSHNSGAIEQDADLIIMLYRDEYYNPDTPDRGLAEVIITKHRNGPTGTVKLLFEPQFTRFRNLATPNR